nr:DUF421 domain-containing protein [Clostridium aestuarii]
MIRTSILYTIVVISMRLMGKRQIGELEPFELVIAIMISDLASLPMQNLSTPLIYGIISIFTLLAFQTFITIFELKSITFRKIISGTPNILIQNGKIDIKELRNQRLTFNDLMEELRIKGFYNISDIAYAVLETNGELSIMPKSEMNSVTKKDLNIQTQNEKLPIALILDGKINHDNLQIINKNVNWLNNKLKANNIYDTNTVFIAMLDSQNKFFFQLKE